MPGLLVERPEGNVVALTWTDGPAPSTVAAHLGDLPGWDLAAVIPGFDAPPGPPPSRPTVWLRRRLSEPALAVAVVRFQGSAGRPYWSGSKRDQQPFLLICDTGDPARSGYPMVDVLAELLLAEPQPTGDPPRTLATEADALSWRLEAAGYDRLWSVAWARAT